VLAAGAALPAVLEGQLRDQVQPHAPEGGVAVDGGNGRPVGRLVAEIEQPSAGPGHDQGPDVTTAVPQRVRCQFLEHQQKPVASVLGGAGGDRRVRDAGPEVRPDAGDDMHGLELPVPDIAGNGGNGHARPRFLGRLLGHT
jgi:hypothetical protein